MKIISMTATFGCLDEATLRLSDGVNLLSLPNESGKSTWAAFVLAMFYGIDTAQRASKGVLPEKSRWQPWNGKAMCGTLELEHRGQTIVLQRTSRRGRPMSDFRAYDQDTGLELPEITGENCGLYFFGVEKSVFRRSAFLSGNELAVTEHQELARRLENLAVSGAMGDSYPAADAKLKQWKNRHRYHQNGLIPEKEAQLLQAEGRLERLTALRQETMEAASAYEACRIEAEDLEQTEQSHWKKRKEAVSSRFHDALLRKEQAEEAMNKRGPRLPDHSLLDLQERLRQLEQAPLPQEPECPPALVGIDADAILPKVQRDQNEYDRLQGRKKKSTRLTLISVVLLLLAAVVMAVIELGWVSVIFLLAGGLGLFRLVQLRKENRQAEADHLAAGSLLEGYGVSRKEDLLPVAMARRDWLQARDRHDARSWELDAQLEKLRQIHGDQLPELSAAQIGEELTRSQELEDARRELRQVEAEYRVADQPWHPSPELMQLREKAARLQAQAEGLRQQEEVSGGLEAAQYRCEQLREELDDLYLREQALELAREALESAHSQLEQVYAPQLTGLAGEYLQKLTGNRYDALVMGKDWQLQARETASCLTRPLAALSSGTQDQTWLALRLAMAKLLLPADAPLVLDDALLTFDDARTAAALDVLRQENRQVLLFSCKDGLGT